MTSFLLEPAIKRRIFLGSFFSLVLSAIFYVAGYFGFGYNIFGYLFLGQDTFSDFLQSMLFAEIYYDPRLGDDVNSGFSQPLGPPLILYYLAIRRVFPSFDVYNQAEMPIVLAGLILFALMALLFTLLLLITKNILFSLLLVFSHPIIFTIGRGNPDILLYILFSLFIILQSKNKELLSATVLSLMIATKLPLVIFLTIFLYRRQLKGFVLAPALVTILFFGSLSSRPFLVSEQFATFRIVTDRYFRDYVIGDGGTLFNNSFFGLLKSLFYLIFGSSLDSVSDLVEMNTNLSRYYWGLIIVLIFLCLTYLISNMGGISFSTSFLLKGIQEIDWSEILFVLTILFILIPNISAEYRLGFLVISFAGLYSRNSSLLARREFLALFFIILVPKHFIIFEDRLQLFGTFTFGSIINPTLLLTLLFLTLNILKSRIRLSYSSNRIKIK